MNNKNELLLLLAVTLIVCLSACVGRKKDAAYYMEMVDSIRKAETVEDMQQKAGIYTNPTEAWFDTLSMHTLPIKSAGSELWEIGHFTDVPMSFNELFNYPVSSKLKALALPSAYHHPVVMIAEMVDSITPRLFLFTIDKKYQPIDKLCVYEQTTCKQGDDYGMAAPEYYITSQYEITLIMYYQSHHKEKEPELMNSRRYVINRDGQFEEVIIEL